MSAAFGTKRTSPLLTRMTTGGQIDGLSGKDYLGLR
jgi:hypothetical protein